MCFKFINKYGFCVVENTVSIKATIFGFWIRRLPVATKIVAFRYSGCFPRACLFGWISVWVASLTPSKGIFLYTIIYKIGRIF